MISNHYKAVAAAGLSAVAILGVSACDSKTSTDTSTKASSSASSSAATSAPASTGAAADPAANLVGTGCNGYASANPTGPASVTGMAQDPVASAASHNPLLTTLTAALSGKLNPKVNLVETLNSNPGLTVFAPTDEAFAKLDTATVDKLKVDSDLLTKILTYHVVEGQNSPTAVVGPHKTLQGGTVNVSGAGPDLKIDNAGLVCGGVKTANATVYLIDTVLTPPAA